MKQVDDIELLALVKERDEKCWTKSERNRLNRRIWRCRRAMKRAKHLEVFEADVDAGRAPKHQPTKHYNWNLIADGKDPKKMLTEFYHDLYGRPEEVKKQVEAERKHRINVWSDLQGDVRKKMRSRHSFDKALAKLKTEHVQATQQLAEVREENAEYERMTTKQM